MTATIKTINNQASRQARQDAPHAHGGYIDVQSIVRDTPLLRSLPGVVAGDARPLVPPTHFYMRNLPRRSSATLH